MVRYRKGAGGQRIGFRSTTAAAEFPVTFGWYSYWLEARLCCGGAQVRLRGTAGGASPSPTHNKKVVQVWVGEPLGLPPHPSGLTASHLPLKGKALKTRFSAFPFRGRCPRRGRMRYPCFELGMLARQTQAREWNRASSNFRKPRAQWPGGNLECHSDFARWKYSAHSKG